MLSLLRLNIYPPPSFVTEKYYCLVNTGESERISSRGENVENSLASPPRHSFSSDRRFMHVPIYYDHFVSPPLSNAAVQAVFQRPKTISM